VIDQELSYQSKLINEISKYKIDESKITELKKINLLCIDDLKKIKAHDQILKNKYNSISFRGKYIDSVKHKKNYKRVESLREYTEEHNNLMNKKISKFKKNRKSFFKLLKDNNYKIIKTKSIKSQFNKYEKGFHTTLNKAKSRINKLTKELNKRKHRNKVKILAKLEQIKKILTSIQSSKDIVSLVITDFDSEFEQYKEIVHGPNSPTFDSLSKVEEQTALLNKHSDDFNKKIKEINTLLK
jgi:hypothetical protein